MKVKLHTLALNIISTFVMRDGKKSNSFTKCKICELILEGQEKNSCRTTQGQVQKAEETE